MPAAITRPQPAASPIRSQKGGSVFSTRSQMSMYPTGLAVPSALP